MRIEKGRSKSIMFNITEKMGSLKIGQISLSAAVLLLLSFSLALAHNVTVFAWVEGDTVHVESKFSGGRRPVAALVVKGRATWPTTRLICCPSRMWRSTTATRPTRCCVACARCSTSIRATA